MTAPLLAIRNLQVVFSDGFEHKQIVKGLNLDVPWSQIVALVGGSGSGKTMTGLSVLRLLPPGMVIQQGEINYKGDNLLSRPEHYMRQTIRGKEIAMVFQEPLSAFNPVFTVGSQIEEVLIYHASLKRRQRKERILELLDLVGIKDPKRTAGQFPHQLSGGMRQRAMIAQAIATGPKLIIADEPTSNLDVTLQAMIIELFKKLRNELSISMLLITHDLGVVNHLADQVIVLYDGRIVEARKTEDLMKNPQHPFTCELLKAVEV